MIKEVFVLKSNSWHVWLMKWIWGFEHTEFRSMCNYTWLTVLNIFILPLVAIGKLAVAFFKLIHRVFSSTFEAWEEYCDRRRDTWLEKQLMRLEDDLDKGLDKVNNNRYLSNIIKYFSSDTYSMSDMDKKTCMIYHKINYRQLERVRVVADKLVEQRLVNKERERKERKEREKLRRDRINTLATYGKYVMYAVGIAVAIALGYAIYLGVAWLISLSWSTILLWVLKFIGVVLVVALVLFILYWLYKGIVYLFCKIGPYCIPCEERREAIGTVVYAIGVGIVTPFKWIWHGIVLLWEIAVELKKNHCPAIEWKDDE